ncbi:hypothetical protein F4553_006268 [Allocatelliglobosispora scoriae]|uniref:DUF2637 domain-containing protein n=1 Tax=Allocatelliglobosispora scoriae TaxID=643052 RepID=A0A841BXE7_9ACTN|nr:DUF2637 domain-containing protein [Allocatelliglobosispora scoriae]MBB5872834.1 hypothetical protein [Allocatelliglobosispora scoriae]
MSATPTGAVNAIRSARRWPAFEANRRTTFWINALLTIVALAASYGAALGQAGFAEIYLGMHGPERYVVFLIIEATAVALMMLANQTALAGDSAAGLWSLVWTVTAGAVTMQIIHAQAIGQPEAAMVYATASVLTVVLWRAKTRRSLRDRLRAAGMIEDPLPRYRPIRWLLRPRETFRAWYLALGEGVSDPATAMDMARADQLYHRAAVTAQRTVREARRKGEPVPDLTSQQHVVPPWRVTHPDAHRFGVLPWHHHTPATIAAAAEQAQLEAEQTVERLSSERATKQRTNGTRKAVGSASVPSAPASPVVAQRIPVDSPTVEVPPSQALGGSTMELESVQMQPLLPDLRAQLDGLFPTIESGPPANGSFRSLIFEACDSQFDPEDPRKPGEIAAILAEQFDSSEIAAITRYVRQWRTEVLEGRRDPARNRRRTIAQRTVTNDV